MCAILLASHVNLRVPPSPHTSHPQDKSALQALSQSPLQFVLGSNPLPPGAPAFGRTVTFTQPKKPPATVDSQCVQRQEFAVFTGEAVEPLVTGFASTSCGRLKMGGGRHERMPAGGGCEEFAGVNSCGEVPTAVRTFKYSPVHARCAALLAHTAAQVGSWSWPPP